MKIKTSELTGNSLNWAVAKCEGKDNFCELHAGNIWYGTVSSGFIQYDPLNNWAQAGLIIESNEIGIKRNIPCSSGREWEASPSLTAKGAGGQYGYGKTPLIAAMRCYVASKLGDYIEVPDALFN